MKILFVLFVLFFAFACSDPVRVTGAPDDRGSTSGTLGSVKAENQIPRADTVRRSDTLNRKDSI